MINRTILTGRLVADPELKYTQNGVAVVSFRLAVNRQFKNANNEYEADFINCQIWRKSAEAFSKYTHKGSLIGIDGRLQTRNYQDKDGKTIYVTEVVVDQLTFLESAQNSGQNNQVQENRADYWYPQEERQETEPQPTGNPFTDNGTKELDSDDLPF